MRPAAIDRLALDENDFNVLKDIMFLLGSLKDAQKLLEGEKYVSISLICMFVHHIQVSVAAAVLHATEENDQTLANLAREMQEDFEQRWGDGEAGNVYLGPVQQGVTTGKLEKYLVGHRFGSKGEE
jgi:hypothetical protein